MASMATVAKEFFEACEAGKGWEVCKQYCKPGATFSAQAEPLAEVRSLEQYTEWMKGLLTFIPDGRYELKSFATDDHGTTSARTACSWGRILAPVAPVPHRQEREDRLRVRDGL